MELEKVVVPVLGQERAVSGFGRNMGVGTIAALAMSLSEGLSARLLSAVPDGTRAQAVGAAVATLIMVLVGVALGVWRRRVARHEVRAAEPGARAPLPWIALLWAALLLAVIGILGIEINDALGFLMGRAVGGGPLLRAMFGADAIILPAALLLWLGSALGLHGTMAGRLWAATGLGLLLSLLAAGLLLAERISLDPTIMTAVGVTTAILALLTTGFALALVLKRLGFVELTLVALGFGYVFYLSGAVIFPDIIKAASIPEEQVFVALAFVPSAVALAFLTVGSSIGFLLGGGGAMDTTFGFELSVALRYLRARRRNSFISVISVISVAGVCLGVTALIVVLSVMSGFETDLKNKILGAHAHAIIEKLGDDFSEYREIEQSAGSVKGVSSAAAFVMGEGMVSTESGLSGVVVKGFDPARPDSWGDLDKNVVRGQLADLGHPERIHQVRPFALESFEMSETSSSTSAPHGPIGLSGEGPVRRIYPGVIIGRELAKQIHATVGDLVSLVSPFSEDIGPLGPQPKLRQFRIAAIFYSGMFEFDQKFVYIEMKQAQKFFGKRGVVSGVEIRVGNINDTGRVVEDLNRRLGGAPYKIRDWRDMNKELFSALLLEKLAMFVVLIFIVLVASFLIVSTLVMIVLEKGREIAILKSMGSNDASIMKIFVTQGLIVGFGGALLGLFCGVGLCELLERFGYDLDPDVFYISRLPVVMDAGEIGAIVGSAIIITYLATIYPAMAAARLHPVEGLRDE